MKMCPQCKETNKVLKKTFPDYVLEDIYIEEEMDDYGPLYSIEEAESVYDIGNNKEDIVTCWNCGYTYKNSDLKEVWKEMITIKEK